MKDLAISPYRYWHFWINPEQPDREPTPAMIFGTALHDAVLEPKEFDSRYACEIDETDFPECLVTIGDMRQWLKDKGKTPTGTLKADIIAQVQRVDPNWPILDVLKAAAEQKNMGKEIIKKRDWWRLGQAANSLMNEPLFEQLTKEGKPEQVLTMDDDGVTIKGCLDWVAPKWTFDVKTFSQQAGKSIAKCITDAIFYEAYYRQAFIYHKLRGWPNWRGDYYMFFIESDEPFEVRVRSLHSKEGAQANVYWSRAMMEYRDLLQTYVACKKKYGDKPWREPQQAERLLDEEIPQLAW